MDKKVYKYEHILEKNNALISLLINSVGELNIMLEERVNELEMDLEQFDYNGYGYKRIKIEYSDRLYIVKKDARGKVFPIPPLVSMINGELGMDLLTGNIVKYASLEETLKFCASHKDFAEYTHFIFASALLDFKD